MSKGISLHIGINRVDDNHYWANEFESWDGKLLGCESDALAMQKLAESQNFAVTQVLLTQQATRKNVTEAIQKAASELEAGDIFFLTYSGHGSQVTDLSGDELDDSLAVHLRDKKDETWCLYDKQLLDDELFHLWKSFKEGVQIVMFSDSCHSGTVAKGLGDFLFAPEEGFGHRVVPRAALSATYKVHKDFYDNLQSPVGSRPEIGATVLLISGCQDDQLSRENQKSDPPHGVFTKAVLEAWEFGGFNNYQDFFEIILAHTPDNQTPNLFHFGKQDTDLLSRKPLSIVQ